jgi:hypothetical protein
MGAAAAAGTPTSIAMGAAIAHHHPMVSLPFSMTHYPRRSTAPSPLASLTLLTLSWCVGSTGPSTVA